MLTPAPVQTTYNQFLTSGQVGTPASETGWDVDNRIAEDPLGNGIGFGLAVCQGTFSDYGATLGQLSGGSFVGITRADPTLPNVDPAFTDKYRDTDNMAVHVRGDIWVAPATNVSAGGAVYYDSVTGQLGASGISNPVLIANAKWMTSYPMTSPLIPAADLAVVRLGAVPA
jgi:hypothetical protein